MSRPEDQRAYTRADPSGAGARRGRAIGAWAPREHASADESGHHRDGEERRGSRMAWRCLGLPSYADRAASTRAARSGATDLIAASPLSARFVHPRFAMSRQARSMSPGRSSVSTPNTCEA